MHKIREHEVYPALLDTIPQHFKISHGKGHKDDLKSHENITTPEILSIEEEIIAMNKEIPLLTSPFLCSFCNLFESQLHSYQIQNKNSENSFEQDARQFLKLKYNCNKSTP